MKLPEGQIVTPEFRVMFQALLEPREDKTYGGPPKYVVEALYDDSSVLRAMQAVNNKVIQGKWPTKAPKNLNSPFLDGDESEREDYEGCVYMRYRSVYPIRVVGPDKRAISDESQLYPGMWGRAVVQCKPYTVPGNAGTTFYLLAFQKTRDDEPLLGPPADQYFDVVTNDTTDDDDEIPF